jgi:enoyl-CoA hydratase
VVGSAAASPLTVTEEGALRVVTLNRPDRLNAISELLHTELVEVWRRLAQDPSAKAVVLTGSGRAFCAGGEMDWLIRVATDRTVRMNAMDEGARLVREILHCPLPIVAAVNGPAVGLGASLATLCDVVVMSEKAFFSDPHVTLGIAAGDGVAGLWPATIGVHKAKELILLGDRVLASDALRLGLANIVASPDQLLAEAKSIATRLADLPVAALRATKRALNMHIERSMFGVIDYAMAAESDNFGLPEVREKIAAILEAQ